MRIRKVIRVTPTRSGHMLAFAGAVLVALYVLEGERGALVAGSILLGLPLAAYLYLLTAVAEAGRRLQVERIVAGQPVEGYATMVLMRVHSRSRWLAGLVALRDTPPEGLVVHEEPYGGGFLAPGGRVVAHYMLTPRIGRWPFGSMRLSISDPLGLVEAVLDVDPLGDLSVTGYPSRSMIPEGARVIDVEDPYSTPTARLIRRQGTEIYAIREYVEGDELRLVDWKATARLGKLYVKELRRETLIPVLFVVAPSEKLLEGDPYTTPFEVLARAIAYLGENVILKDGTVGYLAIAEGGLVIEPPTKAAEGYSRLLRAISLTRPLTRAGVRVQEHVINYLRRHSPGRTIIAVAVHPDELPRVWRELDPLARRGYRIIYLVPDGTTVKLASHNAAVAAVRAEAGSGERGEQSVAKQAGG